MYIPQSPSLFLGVLLSDEGNLTSLTSHPKKPTSLLPSLPVPFPPATDVHHARLWRRCQDTGATSPACKTEFNRVTHSQESVACFAVPLEVLARHRQAVYGRR